MTDVAPSSPKVVRGRFSKFRIRTLLIIVAAAVSFFAVSQLLTTNRYTQDLAAQNEGDLARILASLSTESGAQQQQLSLLKVELANLQNASTSAGTAAGAVSSQLNSLQVLSGTVPVTGPGLDIEVDDPNTQVTYDVVLDTIEELRDAGAEALAVDGRRVGVQSFFGESNGAITLDNVPLARPYDISAIGPAATMEGGLEIPGGSLDTLRALNVVNAAVHRSNSLTFPALSQSLQFHATHSP